MKFVGVDLHKQTITVVVMDAAKKMLSRKRFSNLQSNQIEQFVKSLGDFELTVEATASYEWFAQLVEPFAKRIVLAHPGKLRIIAESTRRGGTVKVNENGRASTPRGRIRVPLAIASIASADAAEIHDERQKGQYRG